MPFTRLQHLINTVPAKLFAIPEEEFSRKPAPNKWSKREIVGHLIDSATNNHHRFIRAQFEDVPTIVYQQDNWNAASRYNDMDTRHLISFWQMYNQHLIEVVRRIPEADMQRQCNNGGEDDVTLAWLIEDYVRHMEHHLGQINELKQLI
jgi:hypothetical protein